MRSTATQLSQPEAQGPGEAGEASPDQLNPGSPAGRGSHRSVGEATGFWVVSVQPWLRGPGAEEPGEAHLPALLRAAPYAVHRATNRGLDTFSDGSSPTPDS